MRKDSTECFATVVIVLVFSKSLKIDSIHTETLDAVFQGSLKSSQLHIQVGGALAIGASRTLGYRIYLESKWLDLWNSKSPESLGLLVHEAMHSWQFQRYGLGYAPRSLWEQLRAAIRHGTRREAYSYILEKEKALVSFGIEQQAQLIQDWYLGTVHGAWESAQIHCRNYLEIKGQEYEKRMNQHLKFIRSK